MQSCIQRAVFVLGALALSQQALAANVCDGDVNGTVTISNADDAREVRENCRIIEGSIAMHDLHETINLDGVEIVRGGISMAQCIPEYDIPCDIPPPFSITSSTLREIGDSIWFWSPTGLDRLILPNLNRVNGSFALQRMGNLTELDVTNLEYIGTFSLEAPNLERFDLEELKGWTGNLIWRNGGVALYGLGTITSVDGLYAPAIDPITRDDGWSGNEGMYLDLPPSIESVTLGWLHLPDVRILSEKLTVIFGGPDSTSMTIRELEARGDIEFQRGASLERLTLEAFSMDYGNNMTHLTLPFDSISSSLSIYTDNLQSITLPPEAREWNNISLSLQLMSLDSSSQFNGDGNQFWYWPRELTSVSMTGNYTIDFFETFIEEETQVYEDFEVYDLSERLDCDTLEAYINTTRATSFTCYGSSDASVLRSLPLYFALTAAASWLLF